jgi:hypothetical protein
MSLDLELTRLAGIAIVVNVLARRARPPVASPRRVTTSGRRSSA